MCGIIGAFHPYGIDEVTKRFIKWGCSKMIKRGPDNEGFLLKKNAAFGFRRLAIRDLSQAANQPMEDDSKRYMLVFNGEIYNTSELKNKLGSKENYLTQSDSEILLKCLMNWGVEQTLSRLDGMFAFAWYDSKLDCLTLARDRSGIKPLYYAHKGKLLTFCSEYDILLCHPAFQKTTLNLDSLGNYLRLGYVPEGLGIYSDTYLLQHGHYLEIKGDVRPQLNCYFDYLSTEKNSKGKLSEKLEYSINSQLVSDVPIGVFQSGGIDSSIVSSYAKKMIPEIKSFTVGIKDSQKYDESTEAKIVSKQLKIDNFLKTIDSQSAVNSLIDQNINAYSEPFSDYSSLPTLLLCQFAKESVTVALSGDGGDELFWGYHRNVQSVQYAKYFFQKKWARAAQIIFQRLSNNKSKAPLELILYDNFIDFSFKRIFISGSKKWTKLIFPYDPNPPYFLQKIIESSDLTSPNSINDLMNIMRKIEYDIHLPRILLKVDRASMYHSLEVRVPMLSNSIIEESVKYNYLDCIDHNQGKLPLRKLLAKRLGNDDIVNLPKRGFTIPNYLWLNEKVCTIIKEFIFENRGDFQACFDQSQLKALWKHRHETINSWLLWSIFTINSWHSQRFLPLKENFIISLNG